MNQRKGRQKLRLEEQKQVGWGDEEPSPQLSHASSGGNVCRCAKAAFFQAPTTSTLGPERTLDLAQTGTHQALFWGRREGDRREGGKEEGREGRREDRRLQLRCQRWRNHSGKERAVHIMLLQDMAAKCSGRDFIELGEEQGTVGDI